MFARIFSRRHKQTTFSDAGFLGVLRVKSFLYLNAVRKPTIKLSHHFGLTNCILLGGLGRKTSTKNKQTKKNPTESKVFKKHVNKHLMLYVNKYKLIHECQSGFRHNHTYQTTLVKVTNQWMSCIDRGNLVWALFIDFRKACDMVDHSHLIRKLSSYKLNTLNLNWLMSYLDTRFTSH